MTARKCSTCKHYEAAPIWRKGWCRNPLLYAPQQNHLVNEDELDCERGMGNYWEPVGLPDASPMWRHGFDGGADEPRVVDPRRREVLVSQSGQPVYAVSGSSGYGPDPMDDDVPPAAGRSGPPPGRDRNLDYYEDDRYWTDYLRIALPILGVLLLLVLFWFWISSFLDNGEEGDVDLGAGGESTFPLITASPVGTEPVGVAPSPQIVMTAPPQATGVVGAETTPTAAGETPAGEIAPGATVVVTNTGGTGVNLRAAPSTTAEVVTVLDDGTQLTVTGESVEAEGFIWWPVTTEFGDGFIVEDYIALAE